MNHRKLLNILSLAALALVFGGALHAQQPEAEPATGEFAAKLDDIRKASLQPLELRRQAYQSGQAELSEVIAAQRQLLDAELRLAKTPASRLEVLNHQLKLAMNAEEVAAARYRSAEASQTDVLEAQIARLQIELLLLEELR